MLAHKLHLHNEIADVFLSNIPRSNPLLLINFIVCSQRSQRFVQNGATTSTTGLGLFFASFIAKVCIIPALTQLDLINASFNGLKLRYVQITRDLLFGLLGFGFLLRAFVFNATAFDKSQADSCSVGTQTRCCFQEYIGLENGSSNSSVDTTIIYRKVEHGVVSADEMGVFFYLVLAYLTFIYFQEKIEFTLDSLKEKSEKGYTHHAQLMLKKKQAKKHNDFLLYFRNNVHNNVTRADEKMSTLSKYFVASCPVPLLHMFVLMDEDKNQRIDYFEFLRMFQVFDLEITEQNGIDLIKYIDIYNTENGKVSMQSFTRWFVHVESQLIREAQLIFDLLDKDNSGFVLTKELLFFLEHYFGSYSATINQDVIINARSSLHINKYSFTTRRMFLVWFRYFVFANRIARPNLYLSGKLDPIMLQFQRRFLDFVENNVDERNLKLYHSVKRSILSEEEIEGIDLWPFMSYDDETDYILWRKLLHVLKIPLFLLLFCFMIPCTGRLKSLSLFTSVLWIVLSTFLLAILCLLLVYFSQTICLTLDIPFEVFGFVFLGFFMNISEVRSYSRLIFVEKPLKSKFQLSRQLSNCFASMISDLFIALPMSLFLATTFGNSHIIFSNYDTNLVTSLVFSFETLFALFIYFCIEGFRIKRNFLLVSLIFFGCFVAQFAALSNFNMVDETSNLKIVCANCDSEFACYPIN